MPQGNPADNNILGEARGRCIQSCGLTQGWASQRSRHRWRRNRRNNPPRLAMMAIRMPEEPVCSPKVRPEGPKHPTACAGKEKPTQAVQRRRGAREQERDPTVP
eukprot:scaffold5576_cov107-Cylindrotheca_fusiformis.AAC.2